MTDFSIMADAPEGFKQIPFAMIEEGDNFTVQGDDNLWRATSSVYKSEGGEAWILEAENADFEERTFAHSKNQLGYAPKFFVMLDGRKEEEFEPLP